MAFTFDPLAALEKAARAHREAKAHYTAALLRAFADLSRAGEPHPYAVLAKAAGVSRQATRQHVERACEAQRAAIAGEPYDLLTEVEAGVSLSRHRSR